MGTVETAGTDTALDDSVNHPGTSWMQQNCTIIPDSATALLETVAVFLCEWWLSAFVLKLMLCSWIFPRRNNVAILWEITTQALTLLRPWNQLSSVVPFPHKAHRVSFVSQSVGVRWFTTNSIVQVGSCVGSFQFVPESESNRSHYKAYLKELPDTL